VDALGVIRFSPGVEVGLLRKLQPLHKLGARGVIDSGARLANLLFVASVDCHFPAA
jgi:hypothetical protein